MSMRGDNTPKLVSAGDNWLRANVEIFKGWKASEVRATEARGGEGGWCWGRAGYVL